MIYRSQIVEFHEDSMLNDYAAGFLLDNLGFHESLVILVLTSAHSQKQSLKVYHHYSTF